LTDDEVTSLALYMGVSQGMIMTSDPVHECQAARRELFKFIQGDNRRIRFTRPLLGRGNDAIVYVGHRTDNDLKVVFAFNPGEHVVEKPLDLATLDIPAQVNVCEWRSEARVRRVQDTLVVKLNPHQTRLFYLKPSAFRKGWKPARISG
jgi:hypothetical protein